MEKHSIKNLLNKQCLITGKPVQKILDFGMHPYADTFVSKEQLSLTEPILPLECYLNSESGQVQLGYITNDYERYSLYSYSYTSSNSKFARRHWDSYYAKIKDLYQVKNALVVEIGSNDGYLAHQFIQDQNQVIGIDPSQEMCKLAASRGVTVVNKLFNKQTSSELLDQHGKAKLIIANNVFNHSNNPLDFAEGINKLLADDGLFVLELPYWRATVESKKFDQVYHEHISYFTVKSSHNLLSRAGLAIVDFEVVDYHGGSLRVYCRKSTNSQPIEKVVNAIKEESELGLFDVEMYKKWQSTLLEARSKFLINLHKLKLENPNTPIIGIGAAAKANTFLNYYNLDNTVLDFITDSSEHKQGKYTPLTRIPIVGDEVFKTYPEAFALILSWNISDDLKKIILNINPNIKFIHQDGSN